MCYSRANQGLRSSLTFLLHSCSGGKQPLTHLSQRRLTALRHSGFLAISEEWMFCINAECLKEGGKKGKNEGLSVDV